MDTQDKDELISEVNGFLGDEGVVYNYQYDSFYRHADIINRELSSECGWLGAGALDMSETKVNHFKLYDDHIEFIKEGEKKFSVYPIDGGLEIIDSRDEDKSQTILESDPEAGRLLGDLMNGATQQCCSDENVERAKLETHDGHQLIYGLKVGGTHIFGLDDKSDNMMSKIFGLYDGEKVKFTSVGKLREACEEFIAKNKKVGPEPVYPQMEFVLFNGRDVKTERMRQIEKRGTSMQYDRDLELIRQLREEGMVVRAEFEKKVGVSSGHRNFQFDKVITPTLGQRGDALFLMSGCGNNMFNFVTAAKGEVNLYRQYNVSLELSRHDRTFKGVDEAMRYVRDVVLHPVNVMTAKQEYQGWCQSQQNKMGGPGR